MKLTSELKKKIDRFFDNIEAEELYRISVEKYGFVEQNDHSLNLDNQKFQTIKPSEDKPKSDERNVLG